MRRKIKKIKGYYDHMQQAWSPLDKAASAEAILEQFIEIIEEQDSQITLLRSRLDAIQHGKGASHERASA